MSRLAIGQRLWTGDIGQEMIPVRVVKVIRQHAHMSDRQTIPAVSDTVRSRQRIGFHTVSYYTDEQRAVAELAHAAFVQRAAIYRAAGTASLETLNNAAAAFGIPPAVAWVPEQT